MSADPRSPIVDIYAALRAFNASWSVEVGTPSGRGWIAGAEPRVASTGPFNDLLLRIGEQAGRADRRTIAASFAIRYRWSSAMAIAPFLKYGGVPDVSLENTSLKFHELCAGCPLVSQEERVARNLDWMKTQLECLRARRRHT